MTVSIKKLAGEDCGRRFKGAGIHTVEKLLDVGATPQGRRELAYVVSLPASEIMALVARADLMRVRCLGPRFIDLLRSARVVTVRELSYRNPKNLQAELVQVNHAHNVTKVLPRASDCARWIASAKLLPIKIRYR